MTLETITEKDDREARAWYVKYPLDAYALGPYRYDESVTAATASEEALEQFGERPAEIWPEGETSQVDEYEYQLDVIK